MLPGTIWIVLSHIHKVTAQLHVDKFHLLEILFWDCHQARSSMKEWKNAHAPELTAVSSNQEKPFKSYFVWYPSRFLQKAEQELTILQSSIHNILRKRLYTFSYKIQAAQYIKDNDCTARVEFSNWSSQNIQSHASNLSPEIFSNKFSFHVHEKVNKRNVRN